MGIRPTEAHHTMRFEGIPVDVDVELCWPYQPLQKGSAEKLVQWVKNSLFRRRRFHDEDDLRDQLAEWLREVNETLPSDATHEIPAIRYAEELHRLRPLKVSPENLALRYPVYVGPMATVRFEGRYCSMPPESACGAGTMFVYQDRARIVGGSHEACHHRQIHHGGSTHRRALGGRPPGEAQPGGLAPHDKDLAEAIVDRILERGRLIILDGPSARTRQLNTQEAQAASN